jgi:hypothetical protein
LCQQVRARPAHGLTCVTRSARRQRWSTKSAGCCSTCARWCQRYECIGLLANPPSVGWRFLCQIYECISPAHLPIHHAMQIDPTIHHPTQPHHATYHATMHTYMCHASPHLPPSSVVGFRTTTGDPWGCLIRSVCLHTGIPSVRPTHRSIESLDARRSCKARLNGSASEALHLRRGFALTLQGIVAFFPSFAYTEHAVSRWCATGAWA